MKSNGRPVQRIEHELGIPREDFAFLVGVSEGDLSSWEEGVHQSGSNTFSQLERRIDILDSVVVHAASQGKARAATRILESWIMIVLGSVIAVAAYFFAYIRQYVEWRINGSAYVDGFMYLRELPLGAFLAVGIILLCGGIVLRFLRKG